MAPARGSGDGVSFVGVTDRLGVESSLVKGEVQVSVKRKALFDHPVKSVTQIGEGKVEGRRLPTIDTGQGRHRPTAGKSKPKGGRRGSVLRREMEEEHKLAEHREARRDSIAASEMEREEEDAKTKAGTNTVRLAQSQSTMDAKAILSSDPWEHLLAAQARTRTLSADTPEPYPEDDSDGESAGSWLESPGRYAAQGIEVRRASAVSSVGGGGGDGRDPSPEGTAGAGDEGAGGETAGAPGGLAGFANLSELVEDATTVYSHSGQPMPSAMAVIGAIKPKVRKTWQRAYTRKKSQGIRNKIIAQKAAEDDEAMAAAEVAGAEARVDRAEKQAAEQGAGSGDDDDASAERDNVGALPATVDSTGESMRALLRGVSFQAVQETGTGSGSPHQSPTGSSATAQSILKRVRPGGGAGPAGGGLRPGGETGSRLATMFSGRSFGSDTTQSEAALPPPSPPQITTVKSVYGEHEEIQSPLKQFDGSAASTSPAQYRASKTVGLSRSSPRSQSGADPVTIAANEAAKKTAAEKEATRRKSRIESLSKSPAFGPIHVYNADSPHAGAALAYRRARVERRRKGNVAAAAAQRAKAARHSLASPKSVAAAADAAATPAASGCPSTSEATHRAAAAASSARSGGATQDAPGAPSNAVRKRMMHHTSHSTMTGSPNRRPRRAMRYRRQANLGASHVRLLLTYCRFDEVLAIRCVCKLWRTQAERDEVWGPLHADRFRDHGCTAGLGWFQSYLAVLQWRHIRAGQCDAANAGCVTRTFAREDGAKVATPCTAITVVFGERRRMPAHVLDPAGNLHMARHPARSKARSDTEDGSGSDHEDDKAVARTKSAAVTADDASGTESRDAGTAAGAGPGADISDAAMSRTQSSSSARAAAIAAAERRHARSYRPPPKKRSRAPVGAPIPLVVVAGVGFMSVFRASGDCTLLAESSPGAVPRKPIRMLTSVGGSVVSSDGGTDVVEWHIFTGHFRDGVISSEEWPAHRQGTRSIAAVGAPYTPRMWPGNVAKDQRHAAASYTQPTLLATSGGDQVVRVWDSTKEWECIACLRQPELSGRVTLSRDPLSAVADATLLGHTGMRTNVTGQTCVVAGTWGKEPRLLLWQRPAEAADGGNAGSGSESESPSRRGSLVFATELPPSRPTSGRAGRRHSSSRRGSASKSPEAKSPAGGATPSASRRGKPTYNIDTGVDGVSSFAALLSGTLDGASGGAAGTGGAQPVSTPMLASDSAWLNTPVGTPTAGKVEIYHPADGHGHGHGIGRRLNSSDGRLKPTASIRVQGANPIGDDTSAGVQSRAANARRLSDALKTGTYAEVVAADRASLRRRAPVVLVRSKTQRSDGEAYGLQDEFTRHPTPMMEQYLEQIGGRAGLKSAAVKRKQAGKEVTRIKAGKVTERMHEYKPSKAAAEILPAGPISLRGRPSLGALGRSTTTRSAAGLGVGAGAGLLSGPRPGSSGSMGGRKPTSGLNAFGRALGDGSGGGGAFSRGASMRSLLSGGGTQSGPSGGESSDGAASGSDGEGGTGAGASGQSRSKSRLSKLKLAFNTGAMGAMSAMAGSDAASSTASTPLASPGPASSARPSTAGAAMTSSSSAGAARSKSGRSTARSHGSRHTTASGRHASNGRGGRFPPRGLPSWPCIAWTHSGHLGGVLSLRRVGSLIASGGPSACTPIHLWRAGSLDFVARVGDSSELCDVSCLAEGLDGALIAASFLETARPDLTLSVWDPHAAATATNSRFGRTANLTADVPGRFPNPAFVLRGAQAKRGGCTDVCGLDVAGALAFTAHSDGTVAAWGYLPSHQGGALCVACDSYRPASAFNYDPGDFNAPPRSIVVGDPTKPPCRECAAVRARPSLANKAAKAAQMRALEVAGSNTHKLAVYEKEDEAGQLSLASAQEINEELNPELKNPVDTRPQAWATAGKVLAALRVFG